MGSENGDDGLRRRGCSCTKDDFLPEESFKSMGNYFKALKETPSRFVDRLLTRSQDSVEIHDMKARSGHEMKKTLTWWDLMWFGVGAVIGSGIFVLTGQEARDSAGPAVVVSFVVSGVSAMLSVFCYTEFAVEIPVAGGSFAYLRVELGDFMAFIAAGNIILQYIVGGAAVARSWTSYFATLLNHKPDDFRIVANSLHEDYNHLDPISVGVCVIICVLAAIGTKGSSVFNYIASIIHMLVILFIVIAGFIRADFKNYSDFAPFGARGVFKSASVLFFAYIGFDAVSTMAEETKNPGRDIPIGLVGSMVLTTVCYCLMAAALCLMQPYGMIDPDAPFSVAFSAVGWDWAKYLVAFGALKGMTTVLLVGAIGQARYMTHIARAHMMPPWLAHVNAKTGTPINATVIMLTATALIAFFTKLGILADLLSVSTLFIFMLVAVALLVRRYYVTGETSSSDRTKFLVFLGLILASSAATAVYWALEKDSWIGYCVTVPIWFLSTAGMKFLVAQARAPKLWGVPLVPWLPSASIAINIFLLGSIDAKSYIRFAIWTGVLLVYYFLFGLHATYDTAKETLKEKMALQNAEEGSVAAESSGALLSSSSTLSSSRSNSIDRKSDLKSATCENVVEVLASPSSTLKDAFFALSVNGILRCKSGEDVPKDIVSKLQAGVKDAKLLLDFYYSIRDLVLVKEQFSGTDLSLGDAEAIFRSIKALSQSDGRWRYSSNNPESSSFAAAGLAYETLDGVISLAPSEIDQSLIQTLKTSILKRFDSIQKYDDGTFYFDGSEGPISTTASVIRGLTSFAASESTGLNLAGDNIVGLAKFFLGVGIPGDAKDFFNQIDALACLEDNRQCYFHAPSMQFSLVRCSTHLVSSIYCHFSDKERASEAPVFPSYGFIQLSSEFWVKVSTVLGSKAPALIVKLAAQALSSGSKGSSVINNQEIKFDADSATYFLDSFPKNFDVGKYTFVFEPPQELLDSDVGSVESQKKLDLSKDGAVSLSANHLQKLRLSYQLNTPLGHVFKPHQAFLKLKHESQVEHIFLVKTSGKKSELVLDFLGLVEKLYYLSGKYEIQLTIGDASMENSLLSNIGHIELDLPERPEKAAQPPVQPTDPYSRYGPKAEISHIFRVPEKLPAKQLSLVFLGLIVLPFIAFLIGLTRLGVNIKSFPSSVGAATSALLFHGGIGAVLLLYVLFWLKAIGSVHNSQGTFFVGNVSVVRGTQTLFDGCYLSTRGMSHSAASSGKRRIRDLLTQSDNRVCADCGAPDPKWASANIGVFICLKCCGVHRSLGTHVSKVLSVTLDEWSDEEVDSMIEIGGNASANSIYEAFIPDGSSKPGPDASHDHRMRFIRSKYEFQEFLKPSLRITSGKTSSSSYRSSSLSSNIIDSFRTTSSSQKPQLEGMVEFIGSLKVTLKKGTNLAIRDMMTSDPYVVLTLGQQTAQSTVMKSNLNPVWNEELMLSVPHDYGSVKLQVFDYDTFSADDIMGEAEIDIQPLITSAMAFGDPEMFGDMQIGKWLKSNDNALIEDSIINIADGKVKQEVQIKLQNVESGELELELEWLPLEQ
ncbi:hypothetical protein IGI04_031144 [Brassica rapa subsp. trilocularis]|nr:hypothetical protein IGI04_031144 [Brassica rapa subsp. trilocularis]